LTRELPAMVQGTYATGTLTVPTRLVVGSEDPVIKLENLGGFEAHAANMELAELQGVGHFIPDEAPDEVLEHIRTFMGEPVPPVEAYLHPERQHVEEGLEEVAASADPGAEDGAGAVVEVEEPWEGYDGMRVPEIKERLKDATPELQAIVRLYESTHKKRVTILREFEDG
jgi:hypothetical protein